MFFKEKTEICQRTLKLSLDVCEAMLKCGAEIRRVENTLERICYAYGADFVEVFAIPSLIICSLRMNDGSYSVQFRRIKSVSNDLYRLESLNALSRRLCNEKPALDVFEQLFKSTLTSRLYPFWLLLFSAAISAGAFALVFGGGVFEAIISSLIGVIVYILDKNILLTINPISKTALSAFVGGTLSCIAWLVFPTLNIGVVVIGTVVLLVPGLAFGNAVRNLLQGDLLSGVLGIVRSVITAVMLALGYIFALGIFGVESAPVARVEGILLRSITTLIGVAAFAIIFDVKPIHLAAIAVGGLITFLIYQGLFRGGYPLFFCAFISASLMYAYSELMARVEKAPAIIFSVPCSIPILPGVTLYNSMNQLLSGEYSLSAEYFFGGVQVGGGIACGIVLVSVIMAITAEIRRIAVKKIPKNH